MTEPDLRPLLEFVVASALALSLYGLALVLFP